MADQASSPEGAVAPTEQRTAVDLEALRGACRQSLQRRINAVDEDIRVAETNVHTAETRLRHAHESLTAHLHSKVGIQQSLEAAGNNALSINQHLLGLIESGRYERFRATGMTLIGYTGVIKITYRRAVYELGKFQVNLDVATSQVTFNIVSGSTIDRASDRDGYIHPHISRGSGPCWGNVAAEVPRIMRRGDFGVMFELAHDFLSSYNDQGPYRSIEAYPREQSDAERARVREEEQRRRRDAEELRRASETPTASTATTATTPEPVGVFARMALQSSQSNQSTAQVVDYPTTPERPPVFTEAVDRDLRQMGVEPRNLTAYEKSKFRKLQRDRHGTAVYNRHLTYYVRWYRRTR